MNFNSIYSMIERYEEFTGEKPYVILMQPETYDNLIEELRETNAWRYLEKHYKEDIFKLKYLFGVPIEISKLIIQPAIAMNKKDYRKYCDYRFRKEWLEND